ncbi:hypothetical protein C4K40_0463 [Pseudomonas sp. CMR5c]|nr:hypothetical protein C4K40_0463 [Pseudomonas sp. CMR5c]
MASLKLQATQYEVCRALVIDLRLAAYSLQLLYRGFEKWLNV